MLINAGLILGAVLDFFLFLLVLFNAKRKREKIVFSILSLSICLWSLSILLFRAVNSIDAAYFWINNVIFWASLIPSSFLYFSIAYNSEKRINLWESLLIFAPNLLILIGVLSPKYLVSDIIFYADHKANVVTFSYYYLYNLYYSVFLLAGLLIIYSKFRSARESARLLLRHIFTGTLLGSLVGFVFCILLLLLNNYRYIWVGPYSSYFFVIPIAYAITKHELMDIRVVIGRNATYVLVGLLLISSFVGLNLLQMPAWLTTSTDALLALIWAWGAHRLRDFIQTPVDKWISWYKPDELMNSIVKELSTVSEGEEAFKIIARQLKDKIKIKNVDFRLGEKVEHPDIIKTKDGLIIPLSSAEGPVGIIILGQKVSEDPYDKKDIAFFETLMIQARAILDRVAHYETIKRNFESNQKKLYDTEKLLARSEKIASMANLIQEYNHQIKTPLAIIRGRVEMLFDKTRDEEYLRKIQKVVEEQIDRADYIVESTLRLSRPRKRKEERLDLNKVIDDALHLFPPSGVHLVKNLAVIPSVMGDKEDLETVFINLIKNAVEAMPDGGDLTIKTYSSQENDEKAIYAEVTDTGVGIPPENMEKIFEPFFSTNVTQGRGLGLSIVFRIIREHLGNITVNSQVSRGSTFRIRLKGLQS